ncbi:MAG: hypothetical protein AAGK71_01100 [Pseudomonadota bacterium]
MPSIVELSPVIDPETGDDVAYQIASMEQNWGCLTEGTPLPEFKRARYVAPDPLWDHDHCELCWATFHEADDDGKGTKGWILNDPGPRVPMFQDTGRVKRGSSVSAPDNARDWLCDNCHRIVTAWAAGKLQVEILNQREIGAKTRH